MLLPWPVAVNELPVLDDGHVRAGIIREPSCDIGVGRPFQGCVAIRSILTWGAISEARLKKRETRPSASATAQRATSHARTAAHPLLDKRWCRSVSLSSRKQQGGWLKAPRVKRQHRTYDCHVHQHKQKRAQNHSLIPVLGRALRPF
jgi:hypothetical protein